MMNKRVSLTMRNKLLFTALFIIIVTSAFVLVIAKEDSEKDDKKQIAEKLGQGLVGENYEGEITITDVFMDYLVVITQYPNCPPNQLSVEGVQVCVEIPDLRTHPKKVTLYVDLPALRDVDPPRPPDKVNIWTVYDADHNEYLDFSPVIGHGDIIEDATSGAQYKWEWIGYQSSRVKLVLNQLPISEEFRVMIQGTIGLTIKYHCIIEEV